MYSDKPAFASKTVAFDPASGVVHTLSFDFRLEESVASALVFTYRNINATSQDDDAVNRTVSTAITLAVKSGNINYREGGVVTFDDSVITDIAASTNIEIRVELARNITNEWQASQTRLDQYSLEAQLDDQTVQLTKISDDLEETITSIDPVVIPIIEVRKGKIFAFNATTGDVDLSTDLFELQTQYDDFITKYNDFISKYGDFTTDYAQFVIDFATFEANYAQFAVDYAQFAVDYADFIAKYDIFTTKYSDFTTKYADFFAKYGLFVVDYADFVTKYSDFITKYDDFIVKYNNFLTLFPVTIQKKNLIEYAIDNPAVENFIVQGDSNYNNDVWVYLDRTTDKWFINFDGNYLPYAPAYLPFDEGYDENIGNDTLYPLTNNRVGLTYRYSIEINGDYILTDGTITLADVIALGGVWANATYGGVIKVANATSAILGAVCVFTVDEVTGYLTEGWLSDGVTKINSIFPKGADFLPFGNNKALYSKTGFTNPAGAIDYIDISASITRGTFNTPTATAQFNIDTFTVSAGDVFKITLPIKISATNAFQMDIGFFASGAFQDFDYAYKLDGVATGSGTIIADKFKIGVVAFAEMVELELEITLLTYNGSGKINIYPFDTGIATAIGDYYEMKEYVISYNADNTAPIPTAGAVGERNADIPQLPATLIPVSLKTATFILPFTHVTDDDSTIFNRTDFTIYIEGNVIKIDDANGGLNYVSTVTVAERQKEIAVVVDDTTIAIYLDSLLLDTVARASSDIGDVSTVVEIGRNGLTNYSKQAESVTIYQRALTATEIQESYLSRNQIGILGDVTGNYLSDDS